MQTDVFNDTLKDLRSRYKGRTMLNVIEVAAEMGVSARTVRNGVENGVGVPAYRNVGQGKERKQIRFPIVEVAHFICDTQRVY